MFERNAIVLQSAVRGYLAKKKYDITRMAKIAGEDYEAFLVGNDPVMTGLSQYKIHGNFALIATSCFRAVGIACVLSDHSDQHVIPKIVIIDSSRQVNEVWRRVQDLISHNVTQDAFEEQFRLLLDDSAYLFRFVDKVISPGRGIRYPNQDIQQFFRYLFAEYGFDYVRRIILNTVIMQQDWQNQELFAKLKNIFDFIGIDQVVAYPSNIVTSYVPQLHAVTIRQILQNIQTLNPVLSIHTSLCPRHFKPEQTYFYTDNHPSVIEQGLFPDGDRMPCHVRMLAGR